MSTAEIAGAGDSSSEVTAEAFRLAVGRFATGITVVTTRVDGVDHAMTANAFTSVSLDPLLVLLCVEKITRFHEAILDAGLWAASILGESGRATAAWFATRGRPVENQLARYPHRPGPRTGAALLLEALATVECRTHAVHDGGDHTIVVGEVLSVAVSRPHGDPLVYYRGRYRTLGDPR